MFLPCSAQMKSEWGFFALAFCLPECGCEGASVSARMRLSVTVHVRVNVRVRGTVAEYVCVSVGRSASVGVSVSVGASMNVSVSVSVSVRVQRIVFSKALAAFHLLNLSTLAGQPAREHLPPSRRRRTRSDGGRERGVREVFAEGEKWAELQLVSSRLLWCVRVTASVCVRLSVDCAGDAPE